MKHITQDRENKFLIELHRMEDPKKNIQLINKKHAHNDLQRKRSYRHQERTRTTLFKN